MTDDNALETTDLTPPEERRKDRIRQIIQGSISSNVPIVGDLASELFNLAFPPAFERRIQDWRESMAEVVTKLVNNHGLDMQVLLESEEFLSVVNRAYIIAMRNHEQEKIDALKNALINIALAGDIKESLRSIFLNYVDSLTVWHIKLLHRLRDPSETFPHNDYHFGGGSLHTMLAIALPELKNDKEFLELLWYDLSSRRLVDEFTSRKVSHSGGQFELKASETGKLFINFISDHEDGAK